MSLNDKYIINGSTLSDIGDALRSVFGEKVEKTTEVVYYSYSVSKSFGSTSSTSTLTANEMLYYLRNIDDKFTKYVRIQLYSSSGAAASFSKSPIEDNVYELPLTFQMSGGATQSYSATYYVYPVDDNFNYIEYDSTKHNTSSYYHRQVTFQIKQTFPVENLPTIIQNVPKVCFRWLKWEGYVAGSAYSSDISDLGITKMSDIKLLAFFKSSSVWCVLKPAEAPTETKTGISTGNYTTNDSGGNYNITYYGWKEYSTSSNMYTGNGNATDANWDTIATNSSVKMGFEPNRGRLVLSTNSRFNCCYHPAIIVYSPSGEVTTS